MYFLYYNERPIGDDYQIIKTMVNIYIFFYLKIKLTYIRDYTISFSFD